MPNRPIPRFRFVVPMIAFLGFVAAAPAQQPVATSTPADDVHPVRAHYVVTVADDFVVEVYHNGIKVADERRHLLEERFGATVERIDVEVRKGDWLVFHVVNNRLRWGGVSYFGAAGCFARDEFGFVSDPSSGAWSACDSPRDVDRFISRRDYLRHQAAEAIANPWADGTPLMHAHAGPAWDGAPVWGTARSTWLKVVVE